MKKTKLIIAVCILFVGIGAVLALYIMPKIYEEKEVSDEMQNVEKPVVTDYACWKAYTFEEAIEVSTTIVYGKVKSISGTLLHEVPTPDGQVYREYYKDVTVEVLEAIKGVAAEVTTTSYLELGGETEDAIYVLEGVDPVVIGEEYNLEQYIAAIREELGE